MKIMGDLFGSPFHTDRSRGNTFEKSQDLLRQHFREKSSVGSFVCAEMSYCQHGRISSWDPVWRLYRNIPVPILTQPTFPTSQTRSPRHV